MSIPKWEFIYIYISLSLSLWGPLFWGSFHFGSMLAALDFWNLPNSGISVKSSIPLGAPRKCDINL